MTQLLPNKGITNYLDHCPKGNNMITLVKTEIISFDGFVKYWIVITQVLLHPSRGITNYLDQYSNSQYWISIS